MLPPLWLAVSIASRGRASEALLGMSALGILVLFGGLLITVSVVGLRRWKETGSVPLRLLISFLEIMAPAAVVGAKVIRRRRRPARTPP